MGKKILIADDEPDMLRVIEFRLKKKGYETILAVDGNEALRKIRECKPDMAILDYRMPFMNGAQVARAVKAEQDLKHIPVVLLTASAEAINKEEYAGCGIDESVIKPFEPEQLYAVVEKYVG